MTHSVCGGTMFFSLLKRIIRSLCWRSICTLRLPTASICVHWLAVNWKLKRRFSLSLSLSSSPFLSLSPPRIVCHLFPSPGIIEWTSIFFWHKGNFFFLNDDIHGFSNGSNGTVGIDDMFLWYFNVMCHFVSVSDCSLENVKNYHVLQEKMW